MTNFILYGTTSSLLMLFLLIFITVPKTSTAELDVINAIKEVTTDVLNAWKALQQTASQSQDTTWIQAQKSKLFQSLKEINHRIVQIEERYPHNIASDPTITDFILTNIFLINKLNDISDIMNRITSRYNQLLKYVANQYEIADYTLIGFAEWTIPPNNYSVNNLLNELHLALMETENQGNQKHNMLSMLAENYANSTHQICTTQQSAQQFIYSTYAGIALTELKGYTIIEFSWMLLQIYEKYDYIKPAKLFRSVYEERIERTLALLHDVITDADRTIWRCDPKKYIKGKTYDEVTRLLQGYIENEVDLNNDETCTNTCDDYQTATSEGCFKNKFCAQQPRCSGKIYNCNFVDSDMWICQAPLNSTRRYEYIKYENERVLGQRGLCGRSITLVESWWRWLFWHCSYCFCLCDEQGLKSDRYFNLRESLSDIENNKVVTGLRFIKVNRVFHLQIQEGELLPRGAINNSTLTWKPVNEYNILDSEVKKGIDYHTLDYESRAIDLDNIYSDNPNYIVTGVRFRLLGKHLNLEAHFTEFNFEGGKLVNLENTKFWKSITEAKRKQILLTTPDIPIRSVFKSIPNFNDKQYIKFVNTDMDKDAAQSTVPYIDIQDVVSNPPLPLSGIGIYHKGQSHYGGFIAPKILTYNFAPYEKLETKVYDYQ